MEEARESVEVSRCRPDNVCRFATGSFGIPCRVLEERERRWTFFRAPLDRSYIELARVA
jgi:hypothetical protein